MPAPSRAQRRRSNTRASSVGTPKIYNTPPIAPIDSPIREAIATAPAASAAPVTTPSSRVAGRLKARKAPEPIDYAKEYRDVAKDMRQILFWAGLLFATMIALYFARQANLF
ncbi:MAG: hypothetical protein H7Z42_14550 [Roseiflexaceae bacterium]|nr:hypothetical protein [Roseiflexaceae bacterium]